MEESDVESVVEDIPSTKPELAEKKEDSADATMKDKEDEEEDEDDDDDDPETSVWTPMNCCTLLTTAQVRRRSH